MKKLLVVITFLVTILAINYSHVSAVESSGNEQINSFDSRIVIRPDNVAVIHESIVYDFGASSHHGIYRDIPVDYVDGSDTYYLNAKLISVTDENGRSLQTKSSTENGNRRIRVGDPDTTITGIHTYNINYELSPVITKKDGTAFLNLDVVGEGWAVPIYDITATVTLEDDAELTDIMWYGGTNTSTVANIAEVAYVGPYQGVTINATLPDGYIATYLEPNKLRAGDIFLKIWNISIVSLIVIAITGSIVIVIARIVRTRNRRKQQIVVAQYEPPVGLSPAHIGLLQDDVTSNAELTATIINWAVHGYIKITYLPKKWIFGSTDYQLTNLKPPTDLPVHEAVLFGSLFDSVETTIRLSKINKTTVASAAKIFKSTLKSELTNLGYYDKDGNIFMRGTLTTEGAKQWALVDGFKLYLSVVEKDRLTFTDAPAKTPERFSALLPYAIALGVEKQWARQFEGIDLRESTNWYSGNLATFSAVALASDLGSSFASTVSSNSSVSSSGGSSGGGFGGGGGGSW